MLQTSLAVLILVMSLLVLVMLGVLIHTQRNGIRAGLYIYNPDATLRVMSSSNHTRTLRPLALLEVLYHRRVRLDIAENELLIIKSDRVARISMRYLGPVTDPDLILAATGNGQKRVKIGQRCEWLLSPEHDLVIRTVAAYEPDSGQPLKTFA